MPLKISVYRNQIVKHTLANMRGGINLNIEIALATNSVLYVVSKLKKRVFESEDLDLAIEEFNKIAWPAPEEQAKGAQ